MAGIPVGTSMGACRATPSAWASVGAAASVFAVAVDGGVAGAA